MDTATFTSFEGRIGRQTWWLGLIALVIVQWIALLILALMLGSGLTGIDPQNPEAAAQAMSTLIIPIVIVSLIFLWPGLALYAKRWHDRDKSGWWTLIGFVPVIGGIWMLVECGFLRGTEGPNRFGPDPLGR